MEKRDVSVILTRGEIINEKKAIRRAPNFIEIMPLTTQAKAPLAMIKNDHKGIFKCWKGNDADS